jgi:hypothetical protein
VNAYKSVLLVLEVGAVLLERRLDLGRIGALLLAQGRPESIQNTDAN